MCGTYGAELSDGMERLRKREPPLARGIMICILVFGYRASVDA